jgi:hypothetical protein
MTASAPEPLNPAGPAQSDFLIHFCGKAPGRRHTPKVRQDIQSITPAQRLDNILWQQQILGFPPFGPETNPPMVCFSESPLPHLDWLLHALLWPPWGVVPGTRQSHEVRL